jgi:hypothetical protein
LLILTGARHRLARFGTAPSGLPWLRIDRGSAGAGIEPAPALLTRLSIV